MGRGGKISSGFVIKGKKKKAALLLVLTFGIWYAVALENPLFKAYYSTVVLAEDGSLIGARIAEDEQWRFPLSDSLPKKFTASILTQEDRYFRYHPGFNPVSLARALWLNLREGEVVSGASTLSMQVIRLSRSNPPRTVLEKVYEIILATRLELRYSKDEILNLYASHAPFGGNVVGFETASWRYFNRSPENLSWAECATLAVLPNAPGLIHPGRNRRTLTLKRDKLLRALWKEGEISQDVYELALLEFIPEQPADLPRLAPHLITLLDTKETGLKHSTTIDPELQFKATAAVDKHLLSLTSNHIHNGALLLIDNSNGEVKAYVGNVSEGKFHYNDMLRTPRSSGSILKPFLYASMLTSGDLLPTQLLPDVPTFIGGFKPQNFVKDYDGAVPADQALSRSLNIPAVLALKQYGIDRFLLRLRQLGFSTMGNSADHYGLSLILGGAEVTAWDLGRAYYHMASSVSGFDDKENGIPAPHLLSNSYELEDIPLGVGAVFETLNVLTTLNRPDTEIGWKLFGNSKVAWKTGTSFGFRDAWAVGVTPAYTCVVWVGNADGEGRPGLIGAQAAGPLLFNFFNNLDHGSWFSEPWDDLIERNICSTSGLLAGRDCEEVITQNVPISTAPASMCEFHRSIHTDEEGRYQLSINCANGESMKTSSWFVLPTTQAWYYAKKHPEYKSLPPWKLGCKHEGQKVIDIIYPKPGGSVFIPRKLDGDSSRVVLEVAHQNPEEVLYWHLNGKYLGQTQTFHQMALYLKMGDYSLWVEDTYGNVSEQIFEVVAGN